nr:immunoglobulin light chain junction region [Mus musculus]NSL98428.1 immunoglobulin light chain junction region [Mus musculus]NSL98919.1 immunoglobulin light chain junction region [Mus musculus]NSL99170.1 immunoglobulin light chain junction region [Mus musculus]NSM00032.1 immunoglobulin light chain junction region [Mus musculus]
CQQHNEDPLTF